MPQGSVLGPLYFIIFINDMPEAVHNLIALFADDAKLFSSIASTQHHDELQEDLESLQDWANKWQLRFNAKKCKVMHLGRSNPEYEYKMGDVVLESVDDEKDLGVRIDNELKFDLHIESQVNKANRILGLIRRSFDILETDTFNILYKSLVRPYLEYCNAVTYPQYQRQCKLLEGVQRRATKMVPHLREKGYTDRLEELDLPSLYFRRARGDIIETYKYIHNIYKVNSSPLIRDTNTDRTRGHSLKLETRRHNKVLRKHFFSYRVITPWNKLPEEIVHAPTVNTLKNRLDKHWRKHKYSLENFTSSFPR